MRRTERRRLGWGYGGPARDAVATAPAAGAASVVKEVQRRALAKPLQLRGTEGVVEPQRLVRSVCMLDPAVDRFAGRQCGQPDEAHPVIRADTVVIRRVLECERQESLLFEIGFVYARKA